MIYHVALPAGLLAIGHDTGALTLTNLQTRGSCWSIEHAHRGAITALACSPDGQLLASGGQDGHVHLWQVASGAPAGSFSCASPIFQLGWSASGQLTCCSLDRVSSWTISARIEAGLGEIQVP